MCCSAGVRNSCYCSRGPARLRLLRGMASGVLEEVVAGSYTERSARRLLSSVSPRSSGLARIVGLTAIPDAGVPSR